MKRYLDHFLTKLDYVIVSLLAIVICISISKVYIFMSPKANVPLLYFWERGSVKREIQTGLVFLTGISYFILLLSIICLIINLIFNLQLLRHQKIGIIRFIIQHFFYFILVCIAICVLISSWDGVIP